MFENEVEGRPLMTMSCWSRLRPSSLKKNVNLTTRWNQASQLCFLRARVSMAGAYSISSISTSVHTLQVARASTDTSSEDVARHALTTIKRPTCAAIPTVKKHWDNIVESSQVFLSSKCSHLCNGDVPSENYFFSDLPHQSLYEPERILIVSRTELKNGKTYLTWYQNDPLNLPDLAVHLAELSIRLLKE